MSMLTLPRVLSLPLRLPMGRLCQWRDLWTSRRALSGLSEDQLADVGLTRRDAQIEAARPFWDLDDCNWGAPATWRR